MSYIASLVGPQGFGMYEVAWEGSTFSANPSGMPAEVLLVPGFVDIHIHGAFGIDFMSASREDMERLCRRLSEHGYESFLPTTVTASAEAVKQALSNLPDHPMIAGFHLEGPFISPKFPGAQPPDFITDLPDGESEWDTILQDPRLRIVTLAPERPRTLELIRQLTARNVICSIGHSDADLHQATLGFEAGARHLTHTFSAMRPLHHRNVGALGYGLIQDEMICEVLYDRIHVSREAVEVLLRCKGRERVITVSDSTMATGYEGTELNMWGHECVSGPGWVRLKENGALAGSAVTLLDMFRNMAQDFGAETAIRTCCLNPRCALGVEEPRVWLELSPDLELLNIRRATAA